MTAKYTPPPFPRAAPADPSRPDYGYAPVLWTTLPNAHHINRVMALGLNAPTCWPYGLAVPTAESLAATTAASEAARGLGRERAMYQISPLGAPAGSAKIGTRRAATALIAWDDAAGLLDMPVDAVRLLAACEHPAAVLLLPACEAFAEKARRDRTA